MLGTVQFRLIAVIRCKQVTCLRYRRYKKRNCVRVDTIIRALLHEQAIPEKRQTGGGRGSEQQGKR